MTSDERKPATRCDACRENYGYRRVRAGNVERLTPCDHGASKHSFTPAGTIIETRLDEFLSPPERRIRDLILARRGRENAISIREIVAEVSGVRCQVPGGPETRNPAPGTCFTERDVKAVVEKLRTLGKIPIAATKIPPYGYFIPATAEECDDCHDRLFHEGVKLIILSRLFRPEADLVEELRGQLSADFAEVKT